YFRFLVSALELSPLAIRGVIRTHLLGGLLLAEPCHRLLLHFRIIAESIAPVNAALAAKPSLLTLGVASGGLLNGGARFFHLHFAAQNRTPFAIPDEFERLGIFCRTALEESAD